MAKQPFGKSELPVKLAVTVPSTEFSTPITQREFKERTKEVFERLTRDFGGSTRVEGKGTFTSAKKGQIIEEDVVRVIAFASEKDFSDKASAFNKWLESRAREWKQESIALELEANLHFIEAMKKNQMKEVM